MCTSSTPTVGLSETRANLDSEEDKSHDSQVSLRCVEDRSWFAWASVDHFFPSVVDVIAVGLVEVGLCRPDGALVDPPGISVSGFSG